MAARRLIHAWERHPFPRLVPTVEADASPLHIAAMNKKPCCYVAGPMRGFPEFNFPAFHEASALGRSLGWEIISPAETDLEHGFDPSVFDGKDLFTHEEIRQFARRDVHVLLNVLKAEDGDAIAMLPGWEKSTGATAELAVARWAKLKVLDARTFLPLGETPLRAA